MRRLDKYDARRAAVAAWVGLTVWILWDFVRYAVDES